MDETEDFRRQKVAELNVGLKRHELEKEYGEVLDSSELLDKHEILGFMAPYVIVRRESDGVEGTFEFQHEPRFYFNWKPS